jgi:hypothetical protein
MQKLVFWSIITLTSAVGSYIPSLWHAGPFSVAGIIGGLAGFAAGFWVNNLLDSYINL